MGGLNVKELIFHPVWSCQFRNTSLTKLSKKLSPLCPRECRIRKSCRQQAESVQLLPDELRTDELRTEELRTDGLRTDELRTDELRADELMADEYLHVCGVGHGNVCLSL